MRSDSKGGHPAGVFEFAQLGSQPHEPLGEQVLETRIDVGFRRFLKLGAGGNFMIMGADLRGIGDRRG